MKHKWPE